MNALFPATLLATTSLSTTDDNDAELIRICAEHVVNLDAYNRDGGLTGIDDPDPRWDAYVRTRDAITDARPRTWAGLQAIGRAARAEALVSRTDGTESPEGTPAEDWAWLLVKTVEGGSIQPPAAVSPDAELLRLGDLLEAAWADEKAAYAAAEGVDDDDAPENIHVTEMAERCSDTVDQITLIPATTLVGVQVKVRAASWCRDCEPFEVDEFDPYIPGQEPSPPSTSARVLASLMTDLVAIGGKGINHRSLLTAAAPREGTRIPSLDADLLEACAAFDVLERAYIALGGDYAPGSPEEDASEAERERLYEAQQPLVDRICDVRAFTIEGQLARARSLALWDAELMKPQKDTGGWFTQAIVRDLLAGSVVA